ncbi:MAG: DUF5991 domain-containing protein [Acutalibacteraceae bacterium]
MYSGFKACIKGITMMILVSVMLINMQGCSDKVLMPQLDNWIGTYSYHEELSMIEPGVEGLDIKINLYKESSAYIAEIWADGSDVCVRAIAQVFGGEDKAELRYYKNFDEGTEYENGELLLTLFDDDGDILTQWGAIHPVGNNYQPKGVFLIPKY